MVSSRDCNSDFGSWIEFSPVEIRYFVCTILHCILVPEQRIEIQSIRGSSWWTATSLYSEALFSISAHNTSLLSTTVDKERARRNYVEKLHPNTVFLMKDVAFT